MPEALAAADPHRSLTYRELDRFSKNIARAISKIVTEAESRVAILMPASVDLIAAELAILKAGCAFVPVDPDYPPERREHLISDSGSSLVLTTRAIYEKLSLKAGNFLFLDDLESGQAGAQWESLPSGANSLAYVIYTSGSTGKPKGVMIEHGAVCNLIVHFQDALALSPGDRASLISSASFDASIAEIWPYLASGASVHVVPKPLRTDLHGLFDWIRLQRINVAFIPTALMEIALEENFPEMHDLRVLITGGDALHKTTSQRFPFRILNAYGPTECTVISTWSELEPDPGARRAPAIGKPIANVEVRILDEDLKPAAVGVPGEIFIAGAGLARGYLNQPEQNAAKFLRDPFDPTGKERMYRTGDRACLRGDGDIAFLGRSDRQVQIRGFRVEPAEIEFVLQQEPGVSGAVVVAQDRAPYPVRLIAFVACDAEDAGIMTRRVRARVAKALPAHMHPAEYVVLDRFSLNANGKIDMGKLPMPDRVISGEKLESAAQMEILAMWRNALDAPGLRETDNFFEAGGNSISLLTLLSRMEKRFGRRIPMGAFLQAPTVTNAADLLSGRSSSSLPACIVRMNGKTQGTPLFCIAGAGGGVHWFRDLVKAAALERPFYGLESRSFEYEEGSAASIQELAARFAQAVRDAQPKGPYLIAGYSLGGLVAVEIANALSAAGERVERVILIDTYAEMPNPALAVRIESVVRRLVRSSWSERRAFLQEKASWIRYLTSTAASAEEAADPGGRKSAEIAAALKYMREDLSESSLPLALFTARDGSLVAGSDPTRGWHRFAKGELLVREVEGNHYTLLAPPHVEALGRHLKELLDGPFVERDEVAAYGRVLLC